MSERGLGDVWGEGEGGGCCFSSLYFSLLAACMCSSRPIHFKFVGEEGVDAGGVTKEFFLLAMRAAFDLNAGLFLSARDNEVVWFNGAADDPGDLQTLRYIGMLVGLALYNGVLLDLRFPRVLWRLLLGESVGLQHLAELDPTLARGLADVLAYDGGDEEDVFCLSFSTQTEFLGVVKTHPLCEGGEDVDVTAENKESYVQLMAERTIVGAVKPQLDAFRQGFCTVTAETILSMLSASDLERAVVGERTLDFAALERGAAYEGGYDAEHTAVKRFWRVVRGLFDETERAALLAFATGSRRAPIGGLAQLRFVIQRAGPHSAMLPTSHTCFNTLLLPEYKDDATMEARLRVAIRECEGFGLE